MNNNTFDPKEEAALLASEGERFEAETGALLRELELSGEKLAAMAERLPRDVEALEQGTEAEIEHLTGEYLADVQGI